MTIVRDKLQAALTDLDLREPAAIVLIQEALEHLDTLEADARRWRGFRYAAVHQDERFVEAMGAHPIADPEGIPTGAEVDAAGDAGIAAMSP